MGTLANKKILITAGPTWVPIDDVRVISNVSSGELGRLLAKEALHSRMKVDLLLGPIAYRDLSKNVRILRFKYFDELLGLIKRELKKTKYDYILHAAAVSDYLASAVKGKISSNNEELVLCLRRAPKIVDTIRRLAPEAFLVIFKLEANVTDPVLLKRACEAMKKSGADLVVANTYEGKVHRSFVLGSQDILARTRSKKALARNLFKVLRQNQ